MQKGDTLYNICKKELGDGSKYQEIAQKNNMIAVCNAPDLLKAVLEDGALTEAVVYMRIAVTNTEAVTIQVNGSAVYATLQELEAHKKDTTAHQELLEQKADKTEVETALAEKVDTTTFTTELNKKANKADVETALGNPFSLGCVVVAIVGYINDPTTSGITDSKQALLYQKPKKD